MSKFDCAREYQLSKRRYDEMFIFHEHDAPPRSGVGLSLASIATAIILAGLVWAGLVV